MCSGERNRELAAIVDEDLDRLQSLVTDTVQMVRVDAGDFTLRPNDHRSLGSRHGDASPVRGAPRRSQRRSPACPTRCRSTRDRELLGLALRQLLDNAVKYSPATSAIEIAATGGDDG